MARARTTAKCDDAALAKAEEQSKLCAEGKLQRIIRKRKPVTPKSIKEEPNSQASPCKQTRAESQREAPREDVALQRVLKKEPPAQSLVCAVAQQRAAQKTGRTKGMVEWDLRGY